MGNYIALGEYNKLYKYIWICIIIREIFEYFYGTDLPEPIQIITKDSIPKGVLIQEGFNYLGLFILSIFLFIYENSQNKKEEEELSALLPEDNTSSKKGNRNYSLIYIDYENLDSFKSIFFVIILLIICDQLRNTFFIFNLKGLDFKMFEILFVCIITLIMFKIPIYRNKKLAIGFIIILCTSMKSLSTFFRFIDDHKIRIFKVYT